MSVRIVIERRPLMTPRMALERAFLELTTLALESISEGAIQTGIDRLEVAEVISQFLNANSLD